MTSPFLTVDELIQYANFKAKTAKVQIMFKARSGKIPGAVKRMGHWYFDKREIDKWDENSRRGG